MTRPVTCEERSQCYNDVNICLWTDGSQRTQSEAQTACQQRNNSFLPRITNSSIQDKLAEFRQFAHSVLLNDAFWIDVYSVSIGAGIHWIDGSLLAGWFIQFLSQYTVALMSMNCCCISVHIINKQSFSSAMLVSLVCISDSVPEIAPYTSISISNLNLVYFLLILHQNISVITCSLKNVLLSSNRCIL